MHEKCVRTDIPRGPRGKHKDYTEQKLGTAAGFFEKVALNRGEHGVDELDRVASG